MKDGDGRKGTRQDEHRIKKPSGLRDYFDWMVHYAQKLVGPNDARSVANEALHDAYRSDRQKPQIDNEQEVRRWLSCLIHWRARAHRQREHRQIIWDSFDFEDQGDCGQFGTLEPTDDVLNRIEITRALEDLSSEERTLVLEYYVGGFSAGELAGRYEMNESTVRTRVARATAKLVAAWQQRQKKTARGQRMVFFLEPDWLARFIRKWTNMTRDWLWNVVRVARLTGTSAVGVALVGFMPGDVAEFSGFVEDAQPLVAAGEPTAMAWPRGFSVSMNDVVAVRDERAPVLHTRVWRNEPLVASSKAVPAASTLSRDPAPIDLGSPLPDPYRRTANIEETCHHAYAEAQTAFYVHQNARRCLTLLKLAPPGDAQCAETPERKLLRDACRAKQTP